MNNLCVGIVGAGMAGLACARYLKAQGASVAVFDKGRFPGGRICTRQHGELSFDHGAQFMRAHSIAFAAEMETWQRRGWVESYAPTKSEVNKSPRGFFADQEVAPTPKARQWVATPSMRSLGEKLALDLDIHLQRKVSGVSKGCIAFDDENAHECDAIVVTAPFPQARALIPEASVLHSALPNETTRTYEPCWTLMAEFATTPRLKESDAVQWAAREADKPGRPEGERWVVHATTTWSRLYLDIDRDEAALALTEEIFRDEPRFCRAHRWRYAKVIQPLGVDCLYDAGEAIGICGDGMIGASVESAWTSGIAMAKTLLAG